MKIRRLHDLDLARIAPLPKDQQLRELQKIKAGWPPYSYNPCRSCILDLLNADAGPLAIGESSSWEQIEREIRRRARGSQDGTEANLRVARGLYNFRTEKNITGRKYEFFPLPIGIGEKISYWANLVISLDGIPTVPFCDPRRTKLLGKDGRRFAFSVAHERVRVADPDFANVRLAILQFAKTLSGPRTVIPHFDEGIALWSFAELDEMVRETYGLWREVLIGREAEARRKASGGSFGLS